MLQQIVSYLSYNVCHRWFFFVFFFKPIYFSLLKQQRETGWWAAAALAGCLAVKRIAEKNAVSRFWWDLGWFFFPSLCCAQPVLKERARKHSCVMELPSGQLPIPPAIMCWKKLVEKGAKTQSGWWCWGDSAPLSCSVCLPRLAAFTSLLTCSASLFWVGGGSCPRHVTAIWGAFLILNVCFGEVMVIAGLCCSKWHCNWRHFSSFMTMAVPLLLVSF